MAISLSKSLHGATAFLFPTPRIKLEVLRQKTFPLCTRSPGLISLLPHCPLQTFAMVLLGGEHKGVIDREVVS